MMKKMIRSAIAGALLASTVFAAPVSAFERTDAGEIIVFGGRQAIPVLDPHVRYDWSTRMVQQAVYDALVKYEGEPVEIKPWLAESWKMSEDGKSWTFKLTETAKFHNGDPVNAEAVRYSFERGLKLNKGVAWMLKDFLAPEGISVVDEHTVRFDLKAPYAPFLSFLPWWFVVNPAEVQAHEVDGDYGEAWLTENAAGSGPFKIARWEPNVLYELEAVADYWKGWPQGENRPAGVIYRIIREPSAQRASLQRGEVDIVEGLTSDDYIQIANMPGITIQDHKGMTTFGIKFNTQRGPTADVNLRKAIAYALDYDALVQIYNGAATLQTSPLPTGMRGHTDVAGIPRQDLAKAKEYLAQSQHPEGGIAGICPCRGPRRSAPYRPGAAGKPQGIEHQCRDQAGTVAEHRRQRFARRNLARDDLGVRDADFYRSGCGGLPVSQEQLGPVLCHGVLRQPRGVADDRQGPCQHRLERARRSLCQDPDADRRRPAGSLRHAAEPALGSPGLSPGLQVQPGSLHRRG